MNCAKASVSTPRLVNSLWFMAEDTLAIICPLRNVKRVKISSLILVIEKHEYCMPNHQGPPARHRQSIEYKIIPESPDLATIAELKPFKGHRKDALNERSIVEGMMA